MPTFTPLAKSAFTGTDENPLSEGSVWTTVSGLSAWKRLTNAAVPSSFVADCASVYTGIVWPANHYSRADLTVNGTGGAAQGVGLNVRMDNGVNTGYRFVIDHAASNNASLDRFNAGTRTNLAQWTQAFADGDRFTVAIEGSKLYIFDKNSTLVKQFDDAGALLALIEQPGLAFSSNETSASISNWEGGSFVFLPQGVDYAGFPVKKLADVARGVPA